MRQDALYIGIVMPYILIIIGSLYYIWWINSQVGKKRVFYKEWAALLLFIYLLWWGDLYDFISLQNVLKIGLMAIKYEKLPFYGIPFIYIHLCLIIIAINGAINHKKTLKKPFNIYSSIVLAMFMYIAIHLSVKTF